MYKVVKEFVFENRIFKPGEDFEFPSGRMIELCLVKFFKEEKVVKPKKQPVAVKEEILIEDPVVVEVEKTEE